MIDWFASKMGLMIFIVVCVGVLVAFATMQMNIFDQSVRIQSANNLARVIDSMCEGCTTYFDFEGEWSLKVEPNKLTLEGIEREFVSGSNTLDVRTDRIRLTKQGGTVNVQEA